MVRIYKSGPAVQDGQKVVGHKANAVSTLGGSMNNVDQMRRAMVLGSAVAAVSVALRPTSALAQETKATAGTKRPSIVFAHGLWADGSCFSKVIQPLQAEGYETLCSQHGLDSLKGDVDCVVRTLGRVKDPVLLVGHSYGGTLITHAGTDPRVAGLVYIAALAPDEDETSQSQQAKFPVTDVFSYVEVADGRVWMKPEGTAAFAGDLPEKEQKLVWATHMVPVADLFTQKVPGAAWKSKPTWYIVAKKDRTVHPELQRFVAKRMGAKVTEVDSSHVPMLSRPKVVLDVIRSAAKAVATGRS